MSRDVKLLSGMKRNDPTRGHMHVDIHNLKTETLTPVDLDVRVSTRKDIILNIDDLLYIDMRVGRINVSRRTDDIAEYITLAFSISVLFALCAPSSKLYEDAAKNSLLASCTRCYSRTGPETIPMIAAGGYLVDRPSRVSCMPKGSGPDGTSKGWEVSVGSLYKFESQTSTDYTRQTNAGSYCNDGYDEEASR